MTTILQFIEKAGLAGVFEDHATKVMGEAFDAACKDLHDTACCGARASIRDKQALMPSYPQAILLIANI